MEHELDEFLSRALDGQLSDTEQERLALLLKENPEFRGEFLSLLRYERVTRTLLDNQHRDEFVQQTRLRITASASGEKFVTRIHNEIERRKQPLARETPPPFVSRRPIWSWAATVAAVLGIAWLMYSNTPRKEIATVKPAPTPDPKPGPVNVVKLPIAKPTFAAIARGQTASPLGYWEYLPAAYHADPQQRLAVLIFFHGLEEGGDGSTEQLKRVLKHGPPAILSDATHPVHSVFDENNVIVLAPQGHAQPDWWHHPEMTAFIDFVITHHGSRLDRRRIYLTGLSAGALGIHELMDNRPDKAGLAAGILVTATVGGAGMVSEPFAGAGVGATVPYWALTSIEDAPAATLAGVNKIANVLSGARPLDFVKAHPNQKETYTASLTPKDGWVWQPGFAGPPDAHLRVTLFPGANHGSFLPAYASRQCWEWLFSKRSSVGAEGPEKF